MKKLSQPVLYHYNQEVASCIMLIAKEKGNAIADPINAFYLETDSTGTRLIGWDLPFSPPTEAEIQAALPRVLEERILNAYRDKRTKEYPSVGDQLDMIYHDWKDGTNTFIQAITAVKTKYPKPSK